MVLLLTRRVCARSSRVFRGLSFKQTDFGIKPISVGGMVKVKDELTINFTVTAKEQ